MNPLFNASIYKTRRDHLKESVHSGIAIFLGNDEAPMNYPSNTYKFRQDSNFLYFFGLSIPGNAAIIDFDENRDIIFGNDFDIEDIIWMGNQPTLASLAEKVAVSEVMPLAKLAEYIQTAQVKGRKIHFTPPYRGENKIWLSNLTGISLQAIQQEASVELIKGIVNLRSTKEACEIAEMETACKIGHQMHTAVMRNCVAGTSERELAGMAEGIALAHGNGISFPVILSQHGETLHNHDHNGILKTGKMLLTDAGAEGFMNYCSDYTRTLPVGGKFTQKQQEIYEIVLKANTEAIAAARPGIYNRELHTLASEIIATGLKEIGLMKGDVKQAVKQGAHTLFFPHGLGHQLGLDVHDMEDLGEDWVGYDDTIQRDPIFGWSSLRMARELKPGFVITVEPGIYFIPQLIQIWKTENKFSSFINYNKVEEYLDFGGIRIEDDVLIIENGHQVLGPHLPKTVNELANIIGN
ncbi:MAG: aminopeptidase P family protein [Bacteroidales bacterium]